MTLTEFLLARIAEDKASADKVHTLDCDVCMGPPGPFPCSCSMPARVLAECEAKRHLIEMYEGAVTAQKQIEALGEPPDGGLMLAIARSVVVTAEAAVKLTAEPHANHPNYQEAWRP